MYNKQRRAALYNKGKGIPITGHGDLRGIVDARVYILRATALEKAGWLATLSTIFTPEEALVLVF